MNDLRIAIVDDNKEMVEVFKNDFKKAYNAIAGRIFSITIKDWFAKILKNFFLAYSIAFL